MRYEIIWTMGRRDKEVNASKDVDNLIDALYCMRSWRLTGMFYRWTNNASS